jgi:excisionase family DNA binding protein
MELLTAKELQELLHVDRSTIYRMADDGRLPALKVGKQWRFRRESVDRYLQAQTTPAAAQELGYVRLDEPRLQPHWPVACAQMILDGFAELLEIMLVLTDLEGELITEVSNPQPFYQLLGGDEGFHDTCQHHWRELGKVPAIEPRFEPTFADLLCARALVRVGNEIQAMVIAFGVAPQGWIPPRQVVQEIAESLDIEEEKLETSFDDIRREDKPSLARLQSEIQRIADILSHICTERHDLMERLNRIAALSSMERRNHQQQDIQGGW